MIEVGSFDAKTHLSSLIDQVLGGEEFLITRRGRPVARLIPIQKDQRTEVEDAIKTIRRIRSGVTLGGLDWKELRDEGRR